MRTHGIGAAVGVCIAALVGLSPAPATAESFMVDTAPADLMAPAFWIPAWQPVAIPRSKWLGSLDFHDSQDDADRWLGRLEAVTGTTLPHGVARHVGDGLRLIGDGWAQQGGLHGPASIGEWDLHEVMRRFSDFAAGDGPLVLHGPGVRATLSHVEGGGLRLSVPAIGLDEVFDADDIGQAESVARRLLQRHSGRIATLVLRHSAATTRDDPVAGNPRALLTKLSGQVDLLGFGGGHMTVMTMQNRGAAAGVQFGHWGGSIDLPLSVSAPIGGGLTATVSAPLRWSRDGGGERASAGLGLGLSGKVAGGWTLGAMIHGGYAGETDRAVGALTGISVLSRHELAVGESTRLSLLNAVSSFQSHAASAGGRTVDYDLTAVVVRNGLSLDWVAGARDDQRIGVEAVEARYLGADLYVNHSLEAAISWRSLDAAGRERRALRLGGLVTDSDESALRASFDLRF